MSYSFSAQAATKAELKNKVAEQLAGVVKNQPVHAADQSQAQAAADTFIDLLADDATQDILVNVSGSLWSADAGMLSASVSVSASIVTRQV